MNRQLILPVSTLVLCMVLLVGIGFAVTTSVTNTGNSIDVDANTIELYTDAGSTVANTQVFSDGTLIYSTDSVNGEKTYVVESGQIINMHATAYLMATKKGVVEVKMTGVNDSPFEKFDVTVDGQTVELNSGNGYTAKFEDDKTIDVTTAKQVTIVGTTSSYNDPNEPPGLTGISVKFTLTPSP